VECGCRVPSCENRIFRYRVSVKRGHQTARIVSLALILCVKIRVTAALGAENWDASFGVPGASGTVTALSFFGDDLIAVGGFAAIGGTDAARIARFDGTSWHPLGTGLSSSAIPTVRALATFRGCVYAAGAFTQAGASPVRNIARWDGTNWWPCGEGISGSGLVIVRTMTVSGDRLIVGGTFSMAGGLATPNIASWDGSNWSQLGNGIAGTAVDSLAASGTTIYAGGRFRLGGGLNATNVAMWNGTSWSALGEGLRDWDAGGGGGGIVRALALWGPNLIAGGTFRLAGGVSALDIAMWNGSNWLGFGDGIDPSGTIYAISAVGNDLVAGGFFSSAGTNAVNSMARWDRKTWFSFAGGVIFDGSPGVVNALVSNGTELYVGGGFNVAGGLTANNIALWHIPHSLNIQRLAKEIVLSWPATGTNFLLEATSDLGAPNWQGISGTPDIVNEQCVVTLAPGPGNQFFRLRRR